MKTSILVAALTLVSVEATAQMADTELTAVPDRPTFSYAPAVVPAGHAQLEAGLELGGADGESALAIPAVVRLGVSDSFELRAGLPAPAIPFGEGSSDLGPLQLAGKVAGSPNETVSIGVLPFVDIASSSGDSTIFAQSTYGFLGLWGLEFGDYWIGGTLGPSVGPSTPDQLGPHELFYTVSLATGYGFGDFGVTVDGFSIFGQAADPTVGALLALNWAVTKTIIIDAYGGHGFTGDVSDYWFGAGATFAK